MITATRYHDFSAGHRVFGHESKCAHLHGHNYRIHFTIKGELDSVGRVLDFSVIKTLLCDWLETNWDHKFLLWEKDPIVEVLSQLDPFGVVQVNFNPTAENMASYLLAIIGPLILAETKCILVKVEIEETRKCKAEANFLCE